ncbi:hypothetical protein [Winogradskyella alexanderae]|uniref:Uncharacterized protein n=1 Tax=Winogradskyella alexanderae TaxID=2877123 RepID=A0ABS7XRH2_9FLAO|nr:hypothetical protein [Winogradskyella alexanderae]MCA0132613.1 hypothetical protein [Winogradskyella alexanderae]
MESKKPKNKNFTIKVTENQYKEFSEIATSNGLTKSSWGNVLLSTHKHNFENDELSAEGNELVDTMMLLLTQLLEKLEIWRTGDNPRSAQLLITQMKLAIEILDSIKFISDSSANELIANYRSLYHRQII